MEIRVEKKIPRNLNRTPVLQQSAFWSAVKRKLGLAPEAFDIKIRASDLYATSDNQDILDDDVLILLQNIGDGYSIGYVPYGPTLNPSEENQGLFLEELSEALRPFLPRGCILLRYDLLWESPWAREDSCYDDNGIWRGPPSRPLQEIRMNFDTQKGNLRKAYTNILPSDTIFLNLKKNEKMLLQGMKPKTRYNIRLSQRKGVKVREADLDDLEIWYRLYQETCRRKGIYLHDLAYFRTVLETQVSADRSQADAVLLISEVDDTPLAAMFLAISGKRATYLYGASSSVKRQYMGTYALQWEAIRKARQRNCTDYDLFGISPRPEPSHPLYGLHRYKTGFGGKQFHRLGCWDYPLDSRNYNLHLSAEMTSQGYHL
jgi:hypothetical protein